jgi:hypothetical protein
MYEVRNSNVHFSLRPVNVFILVSRLIFVFEIFDRLDYTSAIRILSCCRVVHSVPDWNRIWGHRLIHWTRVSSTFQNWSSLCLTNGSSRRLGKNILWFIGTRTWALVHLCRILHLHRYTIASSAWFSGVIVCWTWKNTLRFAAENFGS